MVQPESWTAWKPCMSHGRFHPSLWPCRRGGGDLCLASRGAEQAAHHVRVKQGQQPRGGDRYDRYFLRDTIVLNVFPPPFRCLSRVERLPLPCSWIASRPLSAVRLSGLLAPSVAAVLAQTRRIAPFSQALNPQPGKSALCTSAEPEWTHWHDPRYGDWQEAGDEVPGDLPEYAVKVRNSIRRATPQVGPSSSVEINAIRSVVLQR